MADDNESFLGKLKNHPWVKRTVVVAGLTGAGFGFAKPEVEKLADGVAQYMDYKQIKQDDTDDFETFAPVTPEQRKVYNAFLKATEIAGVNPDSVELRSFINISPHAAVGEKGRFSISNTEIYLNTEKELVAVFLHEFGHYLAKHPEQLSQIPKHEDAVHPEDCPEAENWPKRTESSDPDGLFMESTYVNYDSLTAEQKKIYDTYQEAYDKSYDKYNEDMCEWSEKLRNRELEADAFVAKQGYGEALATSLEKAEKFAQAPHIPAEALEEMRMNENFNHLIKREQQITSIINTVNEIREAFTKNEVKPQSVDKSCNMSKHPDTSLRVLQLRASPPRER